MDDAYYMKKALEMAEQALKEGEVPVGAVIVLDNRIIAAGHNQRERKNDVSSHAEIEAIRSAEKKLGNWRLPDCTLYVTLEPCLMCASAIAQAQIKRVVYGCDDPQEGAIVSHHFIYEDPSIKKRPLLSKGVEKEKCEALLRSFFSDKRKTKGR